MPRRSHLPPLRTAFMRRGELIAIAPNEAYSNSNGAEPVSGTPSSRLSSSCWCVQSLFAGNREGHGYEERSFPARSP
jgi:hypothetical protein